MNEAVDPLRANLGGLPPRQLPRGPHGIPPELITRNQRERLIAALADATYEHSYAQTSVRGVVRRAGVSPATFYEQFDGLLDCTLAAFLEIFNRLFNEIQRACARKGNGDAGVRAGLRRALELLAADPPSAALLTTGIVAAGPHGVRAQHAAMARLAQLLRVDCGEGDAPRAEKFPVDPAWGFIAVLGTQIAQRVANREPERLPELEKDLIGLAPIPQASLV
jgi:AcrR family transcriptional regulator